MNRVKEIEEVPRTKNGNMSLAYGFKSFFGNLFGNGVPSDEEYVDISEIEAQEDGFRKKLEEEHNKEEKRHATSNNGSKRGRDKLNVQSVNTDKMKSKNTKNRDMERNEEDGR